MKQSTKHIIYWGGLIAIALLALGMVSLFPGELYYVYLLGVLMLWRAAAKYFGFYPLPQTNRYPPATLAMADVLLAIVVFVVGFLVAHA